MKRALISGFLAASMTFGCTSDGKFESLTLTTDRETYPYDPAEAGPKGSGDLGQTDSPLKAGTKIVAECVSRSGTYQEDEYDKADVIRIKAGEFAGMLVPLQVYPAVEGEIAKEPVDVFGLSPNEIRDKLDFC